MDRREFLKAAVAAPLAAGFAKPGKRSDEPNLLFLWADQQRPDTMRVYGDAKIDTPSFDQLADECAVFEHPYCTQPLCAPARASVLTGLWPHTTGCTANGIPLPETTLAFAELLGGASYRTGYFGKWHLGDELFPQHGLEERVSIEDIYRRSFRPGRGQEQRSTYDGFLREHGYEPDLPDESSAESSRVVCPSNSASPLPRAEDGRFSPAASQRVLHPLSQLPGAAPAVRRPVQRRVQGRRDRAAAELRG